MRRPVPRTSIVAVAVLSFVVHQIICLPLFFYELLRGKESLPLDIPGHILYVLCWPFVLVSQTAPVGSLPNKILIPAWRLCNQSRLRLPYRKPGCTPRSGIYDDCRRRLRRGDGSSNIVPLPSATPVLDMYCRASADWCAQALPTREVHRESPLVDKKRTNGADRCWASV